LDDLTVALRSADAVAPDDDVISNLCTHGVLLSLSRSRVDCAPSSRRREGAIGRTLVTKIVAMKPKIIDLAVEHPGDGRRATGDGASVPVSAARYRRSRPRPLR